MFCPVRSFLRFQVHSSSFTTLKSSQAYSRLWQSAGFTSKTNSNVNKGFAVDVTVENWTKLVVEESKKTPVILDCWANWCKPCRVLGPLLEDTVKEVGQGKVKMAKVDVDAHSDVAAFLNVTSIPAVFAFSKGKVVDKFVGAIPKEHIVEFVQRLIQTHYGDASDSSTKSSSSSKPESN